MSEEIPSFSQESIELNSAPALVSRLDHQIDLWSICELQAERALYAQILAENPTLVAEVQLQYRRLEAEEKMERQVQSQS